MINKQKIILSWSGGKDSAMALFELRDKYEISALLTTVTEDYARISMHGVRENLLDKQAESLGFTLEKIYISKKSSNEEYEEKMKDKLLEYKNKNVICISFGDIFLEDLKKYRENNLSKIEMSGIFPIWKRDTQKLANQFIDLGFKAIVTCVDSKHLDGSFTGRVFDKQFLSDLPPHIDPCGENGEFHSFVYDGPIFKEKINFAKGEIVLRDNRFYYCDLLVVDNSAKS